METKQQILNEEKLWREKNSKFLETQLLRATIIVVFLPLPLVQASLADSVNMWPGASGSEWIQSRVPCAVGGAPRPFRGIWRSRGRAGGRTPPGSAAARKAGADTPRNEHTKK